jgi:hypothetical protein
MAVLSTCQLSLNIKAATNIFSIIINTHNNSFSQLLNPAKLAIQ